MGFNIYKSTSIKKDYTTLIKGQWRNWKTINNDMNSIFFPIFKEFAEWHLKHLSGGACKLYIFLGLKSRSTGESWYSVKSMASELEVSTRTVDGWLQELDDRGLILRERSGKTSTSYLIPYSLNMINMKMSVEYDKGSETLSKMIQRATDEKEVVGPVYKIYHVFQWKDIKHVKTIEMLVVITQKKFLKGKPLYTTYLSYGYVSDPAYVLDIVEIIIPVRFNSWFKKDNVDVIGIALESSNSLINYKHQKDALVQLSEIPIKNLSDFKEVTIIKPSDFMDMHKNINNDEFTD